jgi:SAM-dependent methyltransferase
MNSITSLDALSKECWNYVKKNNLSNKIKATNDITDAWNYDRDLRNYELTLSFPIREFIQSKLNYLDSSSKFVILDVGCGSGKFLSDVESIDNRVVGYGISNVLFPLDHHKNKIIMGDISAIKNNKTKKFYSIPDVPYVLPDIQNNSVDMIVSSYTLQYVSEIERIKVIRHSNRILKSDGLALLHINNNFLSKGIVEKYVKNVGLPNCLMTPFYERFRLQIVHISKN